MNISTFKQLTSFKDKNIVSLELLENQGYCNTNYKLTTQKSHYLIRKFKSNDTVTISRNFEFKVQKSASLQRIAPIPFSLDTEQSFMITEFVIGQHKLKLKNTDLLKLIRTIKKVHSFKIHTKAYNLKKDFIFYSQQLKDKYSQRLIKESLKELSKLKKFKKNLVLTHHDLNPKNILFTKNTIKLIDWECSCVNDLFFDLASLCCEFNLSTKEEYYLLKKYFGKRSSLHIYKLNAYKVIYKNLCLLWFNLFNKK